MVKVKNMAKTLITLVVAAAALVLLALEPAWAGYIRCGNHTIEDGGRHGGGMYEVLKKCGEPTERFGSTWVYERGGKRTVVKFNDSGRISSINDAR